MTNNVSYSGNCNQLLATSVNGACGPDGNPAPWYAQPVGGTFGCNSPCSMSASGCVAGGSGCGYFKVIDVIFDVIGVALVGIGFALHRKGHKKIGLIMLVIGFLMLAAGLLSTLGTITL